MKEDRKRRVLLTLLFIVFHLSFVTAGDTVQYTLQQCRDLALTKSVSSKSQEETRLAAKYNRQAALAAMFPVLRRMLPTCGITPMCTCWRTPLRSKQVLRR